MLPPSEKLDALLARFAKVGGVLEIERHETFGRDPVAMATHEAIARDAAIRFSRHEKKVDELAPLRGRFIRVDELMPGLTQAFSRPPYGLQLPPAEIDALFEDVWRSLVGSSKDVIAVATWTTDAWRAFDIGNEWWGSFLWTIASRQKPWFVSIAGASSD